MEGIIKTKRRVSPEYMWSEEGLLSTGLCGLNKQQ